jgi:PD-(D/E)XK nuclease superfamily
MFEGYGRATDRLHRAKVTPVNAIRIMDTLTTDSYKVALIGYVRDTVITHSRLAWRHERAQAAAASRHGLQALPIEGLAARLAGGFLQPIDPDALKAAVTKALPAELSDLNRIKDLPGFPRAAAATLSKAWTAGLSLAELAASAGPEAASRLAAVARLEAEVIRHLPPSMCRPADLVSAAIQRKSYARTLFGRIAIHGRTEMSPVWRPLIAALATETDVQWIAGPRYVPSWVHDLGIAVIETPREHPEIRTESCASPRHEALEALRWARQLIAGGRARPEEIAIAAAWPEEWDDHFLALGEMSGLDLHFVHGRKVLTTPDGQLAAAIAEVLLRGFSHTRLVRLVSLLRRPGKLLTALPPDWAQALPADAPLLDAARWRQVLSTLTPDHFHDRGDHAPALGELVDILARGLKEAAEIGEFLLVGRSLAIWRKALTEGPPEALDVTLTALRLPDDVAPEAAIIWAPAAALAAVPRPFVRLIGLTSRAWPRHASEDPLLPDHIVPRSRLEPLPVHDADRRDFDTICRTTARQIFCSRSRRDAEGRLNGVSPLYPANPPELHRQRARIPEHAAGWSDRLFARPDEFDELPAAISAISCWIDWHTGRLTANDGLIRRDHPVVLAALQRQQSATSLVKLLRDPLGYLWQYGFGWTEPSETEDPLLLDPLAFGKLLHDALRAAVTRLEALQPGGFASAAPQEISDALDSALDTVAAEWEQSQPTPPPVIWRRKLQDIRELAIVALTCAEAPLPGQRSWAEIPFGGDYHVRDLTIKERANLPWDPLAPVVIPGTDLRIGGSIDRLDLAATGEVARVTDYKSGKPPRKGSEPVLKGGAELQRCLYAFAVRSLLPAVGSVSSRLLYPKAAEGGLYSLADPDGVLSRLGEFAAAAARLAAAGNLLPGPGAADIYNDFAFALPGGAKDSYFELKFPLIAARLADLAPLWGMA